MIAQFQKATFKVANHFIIPESQDPIAFGFDFGCTARIANAVVLPAIDLYYHSVPMTDEISDVMADRNLASEACPLEVLLERAPHDPFRIGHITTQLARAYD